MKKIILILSMCLLIMALFPGCDWFDKPYDDMPNDNQNQAIDSEKEVTLYFANSEYIRTGNESLELLIPEKRKVVIDDISIEKAIVNELIKGTKNDDSSNVIPRKVVLNDVKVEDSIANVDFSSENLNGGSLQERLMIYQIVKSLTQLDGVEKVQFLIDGKKAETLMGHMDITEPFTQLFFEGIK